MLRQRDCIHLAVDAAAYFVSGKVAGFREKCRAIPALHCAVTTLGPSLWQDIIVDAIADNFTSFDDMRAGIEPLIEEIFEAHSTSVSDGGHEVWGDAWIIGWSEQRQAPEGFTICFRHLDEWNRMVAAGDTVARRPFRIDPLGSLGLNWHPHPTAQELFEARFPIPLNETDRLIPEIDLLQLMEIQRRLPFDKVGGGAYCIGGFALLTSVDRNGVSQRRIHEWPDEVGKIIEPGPPPDWAKWRAERERALEVKEPISLHSLRNLNRHDRRKLKAAQR
jgi:hypothetical protein